MAVMGTKNYGCFDTHDFLNTYYKGDNTVDTKATNYGYQQFAKFCSQLKLTDPKFLEYGGGPVISRLISVCPHVKDIVFADYLESNRNAVKAWIDKDPKAFDWKNTFGFIVQELEGKGSDEVAKREEELRQKIRAVVPCDITAENILEIPSNLADKYGPPYDIVATSLCLEVVAENEQEYKDFVTRLAKLVKPGGYLVLHGDLNETFYMVDTTRFSTFPLTKEIIVESMKNAGVKEIEFDLASYHGFSFASEIEGLEKHSNFDDVYFVYGRA